MLRLIKLLFWFVGWPLRPVSRLLRPHLARLFAPRSEAAQRRRQAQKLASTMLAEFGRLGFTKKVYTGGKRKRVTRQRVQFDYPLLMTRDELWCPIDLRRLPTGVRTDDLRDEAVLRSLEDRLHASVRPDYLANGKLCFVIRLGGSKFPEKIGISAFQEVPGLPDLAFALGVAGDGEQHWGDLADYKHLLIIGATGGGKTTFIHNLLYWLINRHDGDTLELWLGDLKAGAELGRYDALKTDGGIVRHLEFEPERVVEMLHNAVREIERRNNLMRAHQASNLADLNHLTGERMRRVVIVIDEIAMLMLDRAKIGKFSIGSWAENLMTRIASLGRSAGVHLVIATQMINSQVLSGLILANFETRIAFSCADWRKSQLAIETSEADGLPVGRAILRHEGRTYEYQTPLITPQQTRLEIQRVQRYGPTGGLAADQAAIAFLRDAKLLLQIASTELNGSFSRNKLLGNSAVRGVISHERYNEIARRLEKDGVLEPGRSNKPRRVALGYLNRPQLLDVLYGTQQAYTAGTQHTTDVSCGVPETESAVAHQDATPPQSENDNSAVCGVENPTTCAPADDEPEIPPAFRRAWQSDVDTTDDTTDDKPEE